MSADDLPPDLKGPLTRLWRMERPIAVGVRPRDAWIIVAIVQFASRNPALSPTQRQPIERFGRELQRALAAIDPVLDRYLEMGWHPEYDQPRKGDQP